MRISGLAGWATCLMHPKGMVQLWHDAAAVVRLIPRAISSMEMFMVPFPWNRKGKWEPETEGKGKLSHITPTVTGQHLDMPSRHFPMTERQERVSPPPFHTAVNHVNLLKGSVKLITLWVLGNQMNCKLYIIKTASEHRLIYYSLGKCMKIRALCALGVFPASTQPDL